MSVEGTSEKRPRLERSLGRLVRLFWANVRPPRSFWIMMSGLAGGSINGAMCADWPGKNDAIPYAMVAMVLFLAPGFVMTIRDKPNGAGQPRPTERT